MLLYFCVDRDIRPDLIVIAMIGLEIRATDRSVEAGISLYDER
jgi:hypothetical protein